MSVHTGKLSLRGQKVVPTSTCFTQSENWVYICQSLSFRDEKPHFPPKVHFLFEKSYIHCLKPFIYTSPMDSTLSIYAYSVIFIKSCRVGRCCGKIMFYRFSTTSLNVGSKTVVHGGGGGCPSSLYLELIFSFF